MGYYSTITGALEIEPALDQQEIDFLKRVMDEARGGDVPELDALPPRYGYFQFDTDGKTVCLGDGFCKAYHLEEDTVFLVQLLRGQIEGTLEKVPFLRQHQVTGHFHVDGDEADDQWDIVVTENGEVNEIRYDVVLVPRTQVTLVPDITGPDFGVAETNKLVGVEIPQ